MGSAMIDVETVRRLNNYDTDALIRVLELNKDRLGHDHRLSVVILRGLDDERNPGCTEISS